MSAATVFQSESEDENGFVQRAREGDLDAFEHIMRRYNSRLYRAARGILKNEADAEEAVQDAYLKAFRALPGFRHDARFSTWLTRIVINEALMRLRRAKRRACFIEADDGSVTELAANIGSAPHENPDEQAWRGELRVLIARQIDALPPAYRTVFVLRAVEDMPVAEVAAALGVPEATVRTRFFRARRLMREGLNVDMQGCEREVFLFLGARCDQIVVQVLKRLASAEDTSVAQSTL